jgi:hypothetical protein
MLCITQRSYALGYAARVAARANVQLLGSRGAAWGRVSKRRDPKLHYARRCFIARREPSEHRMILEADASLGAACRS